MARNVYARCYPETDHRQDLPVGRCGPVELADEGAIVQANARRYALVLAGAVPAAGGEGNARLGRFPARGENQDRITGPPRLGEALENKRSRIAAALRTPRR